MMLLPLPPPSPTWGREPVLALSPLRGEVVLNGLWRFAPGSGEPSGAGLAWVPGDWRRSRGDRPGVEREDPTWGAWNGDELSVATYSRPLTVPAAWRGRAVLLDLRRVSTDATVWLDGKRVADVPWSGGTADLTPYVRFGRPQTLRVTVAATTDEAEVPVLMGVGQVSKQKSELGWRGIMGDVVLVSRPRAAYVSDVFVRTSTRKKRVALDVELTGVTRAGKADLVAEMVGPGGKVERTFRARLPVAAKGIQTLRPEWPWPNPRLWDLDRPNLYRLRLRVDAPGLRDVYPQTFGFREFWVEGREFRLNGTPFRMRPALAYEGGVDAVSRGHLAGLRRANYNIQEIWPNNNDHRGWTEFWENHCRVADEVGFPLMGPSLHMDPVVSWWHEERWSDPKVRNRWLARYEAMMRRYRNHPSILLWANSGNNFGHNDDQAPDHIGQGANEPVWAGQNERWTKHHEVGRKVYDFVRRYDPTRPTMAHQGGPISDVYTANTYLNFIPLQEREEWLSRWAKTGDMPYVAVEFGTPLDASFYRGRDGWPNAQQSEPQVTEYSAIYRGPDVYREETEAYRRKIAERWIEGQKYRWADGTEQREPNFQWIQTLFVPRTWRAWRTWGISGGMVPWDRAAGYDVRGDLKTDLGPFVPGTRGLSQRSVSTHQLAPFQEPGMATRPAGRALEASNAPRYAWIAGRRERWTEHDHSFASGETVEKTAALLNDERTPLRYAVRWTARLGGRTVGSGKSEVVVPVGGTAWSPIRFVVPPVASRTDGEILLEVTTDGRTLRDEFSFRAFPPEPVSPLPKEVRIIGRNELAEGRVRMSDLEPFLREGGRVVVMGQDPEWFRREMGLRVAHQLSRRAFPVRSDHPALGGLDADDLRDWRGESRLVNPYPDVRTLPRPQTDMTPTHGWRWGGYGAVSSASIEKPHRSGWRPILENEFDLAYSPLLEREVGRGRLILCTLDLEDHGDDPAVRRLRGAIVRYAAESPAPVPAATVRYVGGPRGAKTLAGLGVRFETGAFDPAAPLLVIGEGAGVSRANVAEAMGRGGRVLLLSGADGVTTAPSDVRATDVPDWPETAGLSLSDLHSRTPVAEPRITGFGESAAGGLLARLTAGSGVAIATTLDPDALDADARPYLRTTRWRRTRALAQILANLGATFETDDRLFGRGSAGWYHPDYRSDFPLGDDPYRYFRW